MRATAIISLRSAGLRAALAVLAVAALVAAGTETLVRSAPATSPAAFTSTVEDDGADCSVTLPGSVAANSLLPDPFTRIDGSRISTVSDWRCRREEIL